MFSNETTYEIMLNKSTMDTDTTNATIGYKDISIAHTVQVFYVRVGFCVALSVESAIGKGLIVVVII